jgi:nitronate monooxygenase
VNEIRQFFDGTIVLAGAMSSGADVFAAQAIGADMAYIGTRFLATNEAHALDAYKQMIVESGSDDVVYTNLFSGVHGNYLRASVIRTGFDPDNLPDADKSKMNFGSGSDIQAKVWRDIWSAGQGVGNIHEVLPTRELIERMQREYADTRRRLCGAA